MSPDEVRRAQARLTLPKETRGCAGCSDDAGIAKWLAQKHGIVVIPGSGCGAPGYIRVAFGKPRPGEFEGAAERLHAGLKELTEKGPSVISQ